MPKGGARRGAGRPKGSKSKKPRLLDDNIAVDTDAVVASDAVVDLMQKIAHDPNIDVQLRLDAAKAAAPYLVARIGPRSASLNGDGGAAKVICLQPVALPSSCFLTEEQVENLDLLPMDQATPLSLDNVEEVRGPRRARVYTPTLVVPNPDPDPPSVDPE